jgi:hypothetical protein
MVGHIFVISPLLGWTWPSLVPLAIAAAAGLGYKQLTRTDEKGWARGKLTREMENLRIVSVPVDELVADVVAEEVGRDERLIFERDDYRLIFRRDPRGKFFTDVMGPKITPAQTLRNEALAFAQELVQEFVYNRVMREMEERGINIVEESVDTESGDIILEARRWK